MSHHPVFGPPPEPPRFDVDDFAGRLRRRLVAGIARVSQTGRALRSVVGIGLVVAGVIVNFLTPFGAMAASAFAFGRSQIAATPREHRCNAMFCNEPATTTARYASGNTLHYCSSHAGLAPKYRSSGLAGCVALPLGLAALVLLAAGFIGPILPVLLFAPRSTPGQVAIALTSWIVAVPAAWLGVALYAVLVASAT